MIKKGINLIFLTVLCANIFAQEEPVQEKKVRNLYSGQAVRGFSLHADIASPFMGIIINKNTKTFEIQADINLYDKIFPIVEAGCGSIGTGSASGSFYRTAAPFFRLGLNYNLLKNVTKDGEPKIIKSYPFAGVRYGMSVLSYQIDNVQIKSSYWNESETLNFNASNVYAGWLEIVGGVRVDIKGGFTMGWSVRMKTAFHASKNKTQLWFVPGYGLTANSVFSFNYTLGYTFKLKKK
jgi:hypothetical protein